MRFKRLWWVLALMLPIAVPVSATTVLKVPVEEMARGADLVVRAVVRDVRADDGPKRRGTFGTRVTLAVRETLKGQPTGPTLTIVLPGGSDGRSTLSVPGMPDFAKGDEVVLFLERTLRGWVPSGLSMGKYLVTHADSKAPLRVRRSMAGIHTVVRKDGTLRQATPIDSQDDMTLEALREAIRRGVGGGAR